MTYLDDVPEPLRSQLPEHVRAHLAQCWPGAVVRVKAPRWVDFGEVRTTFWDVFNRDRMSKTRAIGITSAIFKISERWCWHIVSGRRKGDDQ